MLLKIVCVVLLLVPVDVVAGHVEDEEDSDYLGEDDDEDDQEDDLENPDSIRVKRYDSKPTIKTLSPQEIQEVRGAINLILSGKSQENPFTPVSLLENNEKKSLLDKRAIRKEQNLGPSYDNYRFNVRTKINDIEEDSDDTISQPQTTTINKLLTETGDNEDDEENKIKVLTNTEPTTDEIGSFSLELNDSLLESTFTMHDGLPSMLRNYAPTRSSKENIENDNETQNFLETTATETQTTTLDKVLRQEEEDNNIQTGTQAMPVTSGVSAIPVLPEISAPGIPEVAKIPGVPEIPAPHPGLEPQNVLEAVESELATNPVAIYGNSIQTASLTIPKLLTTTKRRTRRTTTTTTTKRTTKFQLDVPALLEIIANLTYDYEMNLTDNLNETLLKLSIPTCGTPSTTEPPVFFDYDANATGSIVAKCFVCGLEVEQVPQHAQCADAFAGDFLPLVPVDMTARGKISKFRKYCRYLDVPHYVVNASMPRSVYGRWSGGCSVRWIDLSGVYTQRTCRNRERAIMGKHYASKRMAKLEMALGNVDNGCITSPMATLVPLSRGISLYARFHACVCTGSWCNAADLQIPFTWLCLVPFVTGYISPYLLT